jgi:hypothetical protein
MSNNNYTTQFSQEELENEEWRNVVGFEGVYSVSNLGRVRRNIGNCGTQAGRILIFVFRPGGYHGVCLQLRKKNKSKVVHRLVSDAFLGIRPDGLQCNHKDGIKTNNRVENLEYVTPSENMLHSYRIGLHRAKRYTYKQRTHCKQGHELTPDNIVPSMLKWGAKRCLICVEEYNKRYRMGRKYNFIC